MMATLGFNELSLYCTTFCYICKSKPIKSRWLVSNWCRIIQVEILSFFERMLHQPNSSAKLHSCWILKCSFSHNQENQTLVLKTINVFKNMVEYSVTVILIHWLSYWLMQSIFCGILPHYNEAPFNFYDAGI